MGPPSAAFASAASCTPAPFTTPGRPAHWAAPSFPRSMSTAARSLPGGPVSHLAPLVVADSTAADLDAADLDAAAGSRLAVFPRRRRRPGRQAEQGSAWPELCSGPPTTHRATVALRACWPGVPPELSRSFPLFQAVCPVGSRRARRDPTEHREPAGLADVQGEGLRGRADRVLGCDCLLYTSDAADDLLCVDLGGRR